MDDQQNNINEINRVVWLKKTLEKIPSGLRILDAGAGEQQFKNFCAHLNYMSQDFAQYKPDEVKNGLQMHQWDYGKLDIVSDIVDIPEPDKSFDAIMCTEVFEHIPNPIAAIKEFDRLLKKGGYLIITAPFCSMTHFAPYHYYSGFNKYFYEKHLIENEFEILEITANGNYFEFLKQEMSRVTSIAEKYTNQKKSFIESKAIGIVYKMLVKFSKKNKGSEELLNFGFHILARKK
ncbi:MAG: class I SAM-dependent methyltransferase [Bacteroidia bacterium]